MSDSGGVKVRVRVSQGEGEGEGQGPVGKVGALSPRRVLKVRLHPLSKGASEFPPRFLCSAILGQGRISVQEVAAAVTDL